MASAAHVTVRKRIVWFFLFITIMMIALIGRLAYLQFFKSNWLTLNATDQRVREIPVEAKRGIIYDRNGKEMAVSISTDSVYVIPAEIRDAEDTAAKLAAILDLNADSLVTNLKKRQAFTWIKRKIDSDTARKVKNLNLPGVGLTQENRRYYPYDNLAAHILGFTGIDSQGLDGIELTFDSYLKGRLGSIIIEYDARGREIPYATHRFIAPQEGNNIYLTIDTVIQQIVEREIDKIMVDTQAKGSTIIVMQPYTGEILALANRPDYNPNRFSEYSPKMWRNIAVSNAYEPGSTFKIITTAAALGEKVVSLEDRFFDPGFVEVQGRNIRCWKHGGHGSQTFEEVVENSCNVGFVNVGLRLGRDPFYKYLSAFGFGQTTGIDLPGEAKGIMIDKAQIKPINIATMAMGQSIAVTPIQLITAVSAVANDGQLLRPQLVREIRAKDGQLIREMNPDVRNTTIDTAVAKQVKGILEKVVEKGTGKGAYVAGYHIAGKTGTAQKVGAGGYLPDKFVASFAGFSPTEHPSVAILVVIDEPVGLYYGGQIAAPVFGAMIQDIMKYLKFSPDDFTKLSVENHVFVPSVINLTVPQAMKVLQQSGLNARVEELGERVADQIPKPGSRMPQKSNVLLYTQSPRYGTGEVTVPNLQDKTLEESSQLLSDIGLVIKPVGEKGKVINQEPITGTKVSAGSIVTVYLE